MIKRSLQGGLLTGLMALLTTTGAQAQDGAAALPTVREVTISGASAEETEKIRKLLRTRTGEPIDPDRQREDLRRLYESGLVRPDVRVDSHPAANGGVRLEYVVSPNPTLRDIVVSGNTQLTDKRIKNAVGLKAGDSLSALQLSKAQTAVQRVYDAEGFFDATVRTEERPGAGNSSDLAVIVDEGTRIRLRDVKFEGNNSFTGLRLVLQMNNKGSFGPFKRYYNETRFEEDIKTLQTFYGSRGFLDVDVRRGNFQYGPDNKWLDATISITEGPRYKVGRVSGRGFTLFGEDEVLTPFRSLQGKTFSQTLFSSAVRRVSTLYGNEGFLAASIEPEFHKDPVNGVVDVDLVFTEGPRIYVGDVKVVAETYPEDAKMSWLRRVYSRFSPPVKDEVIRREVQLKPGQVYRRFEEVRTKDRLRELGIFEDVQVRSQLTGNSAVRDAVVAVKEGNTGNVLFGVGFGDVEGGFGYVSYVERNLFGMARDLRASFMLGSLVSSGEISYMDRYFLGSDRSARFSLYQRNALRTGRFRQVNTGISAEYIKPLDDRRREAIRFRLENVGFQLRGEERPLTNLDDYVVAALRYRLSGDTRDKVYLPDEGYLASAGIETGVARGFLAKVDTRLQKWVPISDDWNYQLDLSGGFIPIDAKNIGYGERFFMGGNNDLRGFQIYGAGPHDPKNTNIPIGGSWKLLVKQELRYRFTEDLAAVGFFDAGTLSDKFLSIESPRASLGGGVRIRIPVATIGLDLGFPVLKQKRDQDQFFHFTLNSGM